MRRSGWERMFLPQRLKGKRPSQFHSFCLRKSGNLLRIPRDGGSLKSWTVLGHIGTASRWYSGVHGN